MKKWRAVATSEEKVISAVCQNKDAHVILGESPELFGAYEDVFEFIKDHYLRFKSVPSQEVLNDKFGDMGFVETTSPTKYYLDELKNDFLKARLEQIVLKASNALGKGESPKNILDKSQTALAKLGKYTNNVRDLELTNAEEAASYFEKLAEISEGKGGQPGISTGFKSIDSAYSTGMAPGHSIVLMGYTSRAKSMWSALLAVKAWQQGYKVMIVSLEMSPEEYRERVYAMMSEGLFTIDDLSRGDIDPDDFRTWSKKMFEDSTNFVVVSNQGVGEVTPNMIQAKIDTHAPDLVILDYMQLMMDNAKSSTMTPRMMNLSRETKMLAVSNNIPIVSITAVTDEDGDKRDGPPLLSQVAWSHAIEYDANLVIAVHRHDKVNPLEDDLIEVVGRKNRHGELFDFYFSAKMNKGQWVEKFDM